MPYTTGLLRHRVAILNRTTAAVGKYGVDSDGVVWAEALKTWASVDFSRGTRAMHAGALDAYAVVLVRMRYTPVVTERSRMVYDGNTYQVLPETLHADHHGNTVQFTAQRVVE